MTRADLEHLMFFQARLAETDIDDDRRRLGPRADRARRA